MSLKNLKWAAILYHGGLLALVRGLMEYKDIRKEGREFSYKWPMYFLVAASFWNFLGAGIFGFLINLPIINFYEHGTYLTMHHGHTAMFGTYGMLFIARLLFSWRGLVDKAHWKDGIRKLSFFSARRLMLPDLFYPNPTSLSLPNNLYQDFRYHWIERGESFRVPAVKPCHLLKQTYVVSTKIPVFKWLVKGTEKALKNVLETHHVIKYTR